MATSSIKVNDKTLDGFHKNNPNLDIRYSKASIDYVFANQANGVSIHFHLYAKRDLEEMQQVMPKAVVRCDNSMSLES